MAEITLRDLYKLRSTLKSRMTILNKIKEGGHYKNDTHSRGIESFIDKFLDTFCAKNGTDTNSYSTTNNNLSRGVKGQMQKLVVELRIILKNEGNKVLTYEILCKLVKEYYPTYEKMCETRKKRGDNKPYNNTKRLYPGHVKLRRLLDIEEKQGFKSFEERYFNPYGDAMIKINLP